MGADWTATAKKMMKRYCQDNGLSGWPFRRCAAGMASISYRRYWFPVVVIPHAVRLYLRVSLSCRYVEDLLAERGLDVLYESVRSWGLKFGPMIARRLRGHRTRPNNCWHVDEIVVRIAYKRMYIWRSIDHEGEILDMLVQRQRDKRAAVRLMRKNTRLRTEDGSD
jgi:transposase-like protein